MRKIKFEERINVIKDQINRKRGKWQLRAINWMDYDDISSILMIHIYRKWKKWDQTKALEPWLNTVISNQINNLIRNNYSNYAKPCLNCAESLGGNDCKKFRTQGSPCPLFIKWIKTRKRAYDMKLPVTMEHHTQEVFSIPTDNFCLEKSIPIFHRKMLKLLKGVEREIYEQIFIKLRDEKKVAKEMGYKEENKGRATGRYKRIRQLINNIIIRAKAMLAEQGLEA